MEVGELVPVKYDPKKPDKGRQGSPFKLWGLPGFMVLMGVLFLVGSSRVGGG